MATKWFTYDGSDPADPTHYTLIGDTAPTCSGATQQLCAIHAENDSNNLPELDLTIALEMVQALQSQTNSANVNLKAR